MAGEARVVEACKFWGLRSNGTVAVESW